jgi:uncharacterized low-complexity protein
MKIHTLLIELTVAVSLVGAAGLAMAAGAAAHNVETEPSDLDPALIAKIAKMKAKSQTLGGDSKIGPAGEKIIDGSTAGRGRCGNVDIGNVSSTGPAWQIPREITVVITGDVVNAGNSCKN